MTNHLLIVRTLRTAVPVLVGSALAWAISFIPAIGDVFLWLEDSLGQDPTEVIAGIATALVIVLYYVVISWLAKYWPWLEGFLGSTKRPVDYVTQHEDGLTEEETR